MKNARHAKILELIEHQSIDKQEELLKQLHSSGFNVTQATVSRDIRELHLVKTATGDGGFRYVSSFNREKPRHQPNRFETIFRESVLKSDHAGNFVMVKCFTGMANAACEVFDSMTWSDVVGTLAGDDTFLVLTRSEAAAQQLSTQLQQYIVRH
ncbi:arginine repressor [Ruminococcaceae bacterium OttesenSCG-928-A16]|nr:arginine repressor [Ruminococcaceae bacterium OttesenSCG-928-A16]